MKKYLITGGIGVAALVLFLFFPNSMAYDLVYGVFKGLAVELGKLWNDR